MTGQKLPPSNQLAEPLLAAMHRLSPEAGTRRRTRDIYDEVARAIALPEELVSMPRKNGSSTTFKYRLAWARTLLKNCGLVEDEGRGLWSLTREGFLRGEHGAGRPA